jgi:hypothetical protein
MDHRNNQNSHHAIAEPGNSFEPLLSTHSYKQLLCISISSHIFIVFLVGQFRYAASSISPSVQIWRNTRDKDSMEKAERQKGRKAELTLLHIAIANLQPNLLVPGIRNLSTIVMLQVTASGCCGVEIVL